MAKKTKQAIEAVNEVPKPTISGSVLGDAMESVAHKHEVHGETVPSFQMMSELWSVYIKHSHYVRAEPLITPRDVAQLMNLLKVARSVYGDSVDNFIDSAGYAALAAEFRHREGRK